MNRLIITLLIILISHTSLMAGVYFKDTKEDTIEKRYSKKALKGEEIVNLRLSKSDFSDGVAKQVYPIFISSKDVTYINFEDAIMSVEGGGLGQDIAIGFNPQQKENGFSLKSTNDKLSPKTIQVRLASGNKVYLKVITSMQQHANSVINFLNYKPSQKQSELARLTYERDMRTEILSNVFEHGVIHYPLNLKKKINNSELTLINMNVLGNTYYCILKFSGTENLEVNKDAISLEIMDLNSSFFSSKRQKQTVYNVNSIVVHPVSETVQMAILSFELPKQYRYFQFNLWVGQKSFFTQKVTLNLATGVVLNDPLEWSPL